jgi:hypothetical protein
MNTAPELSKQEIADLVDRRIARHPWAGRGSAIVLWLLIALLVTAMFYLLGRTTAIVMCVLSLGVVYLRAALVDRRAFERSLLWEQIYRAPRLKVCTFEFASWFYAEAHPSEYLFVIEARDGRWFHVISEDAYYFTRDGVPARWAVRVYPNTQQVIEVTGADSLGLVEPRRIEISDSEQLKEFGEYLKFDALPAALRVGVAVAQKEKKRQHNS